MKPKSFILTIAPSGTITAIYSDQLAGLIAEGAATIRRASHVEPEVGGGWAADLSPVGGPKLGPFHLRAEALEAEVQWLEKNLLGVRR